MSHMEEKSQASEEALQHTELQKHRAGLPNLRPGSTRCPQLRRTGLLSASTKCQNPHIGSRNTGGQALLELLLGNLSRSQFSIRHPTGAKTKLEQ